MNAFQWRRWIAGQTCRIKLRDSKDVWMIVRKPTRLSITHLSIHFCFIRRRHELSQESIKLSALNEAVAWKKIKEEKIIFGFTNILDLMKTKKSSWPRLKGVLDDGPFSCVKAYFIHSCRPAWCFIACNGTIYCSCEWAAYKRSKISFCSVL